MGNIFPLPPIVKEPWIEITNASDTDCESENHIKYVAEVVVLSTAAFLCVFLNVVKWITARSLRGGVVVPVDLLSVTPFRLTYCLILTLMATDVFHELVTPSLYYISPNNALLDAFKLFGLTPTVIFLRQSLIYFPLLACVDFTAAPCLGHGIGFLYTLLVGCYNVYVESVVLRGCWYKSNPTHVDIIISVCVKGPAFIGYLVAAGWFFYRAATETVLLLFARKNGFDKDGARVQHFHNHVRSLLCRKEKSVKRSRSRNLLRFLQWGLRYVLPYESSYRYPLGFLAPICMGWMVIYQLCVQLIYLEVNLAHDLIHFMNSFNITVVELSKFLSKDATHTVEEVWYDAKSFAESLLIILPLGASVGLGLSAFFLMYLTQNFHKRMVRISRGDISFIIASEPLPSKPYILAAGMKFSAFQLGYLVCGWVLYTFLYSALQAIGLIFYYLFKDFNLLGIRVWSFFFIPMMWAAGMHTLQLFLCRFVFWKRWRDQGDVIRCRFRTVYLFLAYLFFFFNMLFAVVLSGLRVFGSFMFTMVMYFRIDWDVYMRGLEGWDFGHRTYVGYMYLQYTQNNAVLRTFVQLLHSTHCSLSNEEKNTTIQKFSRNSSSSSLHSDSNGLLDDDNYATMKPCATINAHAPNPEQYARSRKARNLWLVAYTLIHNPQLQPLIASQLQLPANVVS